MSDNTFDDVAVHAAALADLIEQEDYDSAINELALLSVLIRRLSHAELSDLDNDKQQYLFRLAQWLADEDGMMDKRSRQLIDIIAPFNQKSGLKANKKYQGKRSDG